MAERLHILIVDDDPQFVETVTTLLKSVGYRTSHTYHVEKAVELAEKEKPDLILLDVMFIDQPGPDGITLSMQLHENPSIKNIPVLIQTRNIPTGTVTARIVNFLNLIYRSIARSRQPVMKPASSIHPQFGI